MGIWFSKSRNVKSYCHQHGKWNEHVFRVKNIEDWKAICFYMFEDGIIHEGRLQVLHQFTVEVVNHLKKEGYDTSAQEIWQSYQTINTTLRQHM